MADPADLSLTEAVRAVHAGELGTDEPRQACRSRIDARDRELAAWAALDLDGDGGDVEPPAAGLLQGAALGVKDVVHVAGLPTRAGSRHFEVLPDQDAPAVARLRAEGA